MSWLRTRSVTEAEQSSEELWARLRNDQASGGFWSERIRGLKSEPEKRLALAIENLPLPAAFREAIVSLRAIIRERRKEKESYVEELSFLYQLAAMESFSIPYSSFLRQPGFNVIESMPGQVVQSLPFTYRDLGYSQLRLLNRTDAKWLVEVWGEPIRHTTLHEIHQDVWKKYERELKVKQDDQLARLLSGVGSR